MPTRDQVAKRPARPDDASALAIASQVARIIGSSSSAAHALADYEQRKAAGEDPVLLIERGVYFVVNMSAIARHHVEITRARAACIGEQDLPGGEDR